MRILIFTIGIFVSTYLSAQTGTVKDQLGKLQTVVPLTHNAKVQQSIDDLIANKDGRTEMILGKSAAYLSEIEDSLNAHNLPAELQFLIPTLSKYDNWVISDDGGSGYWQLRYIVAKRYGLKISSYIDERRDYRKATSAAIGYLKYLHAELGDWHAVIAAFLGDEFEVRKAIRMAENKTNYWDYESFLPLKYQEVVPNFIANVYVHSYYESYKLKPKAYNRPNLEEVPIEQWVTIYQLSKALDVPFEDLKDYNAIYKKQVIPNTDKVYQVKIPFEKVGLFYELGDSIYRYKSHATESGNVEPVAKKEEPSVEEPAVAPVVNTGPRLIYYTVRSGDYLGRIADLYDVNISDLRKWNHIRGDHIAVNQRLKIYKSSADYAKYNKINSMTAAQRNKLINKD